MPRRNYHQSTGNPIQQDRLPTLPLELECAYHRGEDNNDLSHTRIILFELLGWSLIGLLVCLLPHALLTQSFLVLVACFYLGMFVWKNANRRKWTIGWVGPLAIPMALAGYWLNLPIAVAVYVALVGNVLIARIIVRHFTFIATTAPTPMKEAWAIRDAANWQTLYSSLILLPVAVGMIVPGAMLVMLGLTCLIWLAVGLWFIEQPDRFIGNLWRSITLWCCYNRGNHSLPGILVSPAGSSQQRVILLGVMVMLNLFMLVRVGFAADGGVQPLGDEIESIIAFLVVLLIMAMVNLVSVFMMIAIIGTPVFGRLTTPEPGIIPVTDWNVITERVRNSSNPIESDSLYLGRVAFDQSPLLVPTALFREHAHFLGDTGSGKTARGLAPLIEQLLSRGDASVMVLDLKGDSHELLQTVRHAAASAQTATGQSVPVRTFTTREDRSTHSFNPFALSCWTRLNLVQRTDILCAALGLNYGIDYGEGYFSSANASVLHATLTHFPNIESFEHVRDAGNHVRMTVWRLRLLNNIPANCD